MKAHKVSTPRLVMIGIQYKVAIMPQKSTLKVYMCQPARRPCVTNVVVTPETNMKIRTTKLGIIVYISTLTHPTGVMFVEKLFSQKMI